MNKMMRQSIVTALVALLVLASQTRHCQALEMSATNSSIGAAKTENVVNKLEAYVTESKQTSGLIADEIQAAKKEIESWAPQAREQFKNNKPLVYSVAHVLSTIPDACDRADIDRLEKIYKLFHTDFQSGRIDFFKAYTNAAYSLVHSVLQAISGQKPLATSLLEAGMQVFLSNLRDCKQAECADPQGALNQWINANAQVIAQDSKSLAKKMFNSISAGMKDLNKVKDTFQTEMMKAGFKVVDGKFIPSQD